MWFSRSSCGIQHMSCWTMGIRIICFWLRMWKYLADNYRMVLYDNSFEWQSIHNKVNMISTAKAVEIMFLLMKRISIQVLRWNAVVLKLRNVVRFVCDLKAVRLYEHNLKRVKGRIAIRPYTATRNSGSRRYPAQKRAFVRYEPDSHSELKIAEILPHK